MATMTVRTTFALDPETEEAIRRLARLWGTSMAGVVRRAVAEAGKAAGQQGAPSPLDALDWLQANATLTETEVRAWRRDSRRGWEEAWARHAGATRSRTPRERGGER